MKTASYMAVKVKQASGNDIDPKFFNQVAQCAHFGMMYFAVTMCALIGRFFGHYWIGVCVGGAFDLCYGIWHEFFWDPTHENAVTRGSDVEDFIWLEVGNVTGFLVTWFLVARV